MKPTILIVDDDPDLANTLSRSFVRRGFNTLIGHSKDHALVQAERSRPGFAVVDLKLGGPSGIDCVKDLAALDPGMRIVVLTGYASVTTAIEAVKSGAHAFLAKPSTADDILAAFDLPTANRTLPQPEKQMSLRDLEWERITRTLLDNKFNISVTAEALGMARRHLQKRLKQGQTPTGELV